MEINNNYRRKRVANTKVLWYIVKRNIVLLTKLSERTPQKTHQKHKEEFLAMKLTKRFLSALLVLAMVLTVCPVIPFAATAAETKAETVVAHKFNNIGSAGSLAGMPENVRNVTYLSDLHNQSAPMTIEGRVIASVNNKIVLNGNYNSNLYVWSGGSHYQINASGKVDANGNRTINGVTYNKADIALGYHGTLFEKGLGVHPDGIGGTGRYIVYDIRGLNVDHFYSVVGGTTYTTTSNKVTDCKIDFEVWGSTADAYDEATFVKLGYAEAIRQWLCAEIDLNISGYNFIKVLVKHNSASKTNDASGVAWGGACFYDDPYTATDNFVAYPQDANCTEEAKYAGVPAGATATSMANSEYVKDSFIYPNTTAITKRPVGVNHVFNSETTTSVKIGYPSVTKKTFLDLHLSRNTDTTDTYVILDVQGKGDRFYSLVGLTNAKAQDGRASTGAVFLVYGSKDESWESASYERLASSGAVYGYNTGEFDVDITGYNYLKLEVIHPAGQTSNASGQVTWIDPTVYTVETWDQFEGKTVSILGDSISTWTHIHNDITANTTIGNNAGYYGVGTCGLETRQDTWWQQVIDALDMELVVNNSWGGSCVWNPREGVDNQAGAPTGSGTRSQNLHNNNENTEEYPDVIFVFMGTNDFQYKSEEYPIGSTPADFEKVLAAGEPTSACEAYAIMLNNIQTAYPDAEVYCLTPLQETEEKDPDDTLKDWVASIKAIAAHFGCGVVDLYNDSGITTENLDIYTGDEKKIHPNCEGMDLITKAVLNVMLGSTIELYDVSFDLENVESVDGHIAIAGDSYTATLRAAENVKVTMGGEDITSSCYANGVVTIDKVTGDVVITASSDSVRVNTIGKNDSLNGRPASANLQYLSALYNDSNYMISSNNPVKLNQAYSDPGYYFINGVHKSGDGGKTGDPDCVDAEGYRTFTLSDGTELKLHKLGINLGHTAVPYSSGLGVHPNSVGAEDRAIVYNVSDLGDRFYAVVGVNGYNITDPDYYSRYVNFEVWGSVDGNSYERIAHALNVRAYLTAEFDLDISGYSYIKLVTRMSDESRNNWSCAAAWADACVYDLAIVNTSNNIRLQDSLKIGYFFTVDGSITPSSVGAKLWTAADYAAGKEGTDFANLKLNDDGEYSVENAGVCAQDIGDVYVMVPYYVDSNGDYHYGQAVAYSVLEYCEKVYNMTEQDWINKGQTAEKGAATKLIVIDLLNYATAASAYFDGISAQAYNSFLKPEEQVVGWVEGTHSRENHPEDLFQGSQLAELDGRNINLNESIHLGIYLIDTYEAITDVSWRTADGSEYTLATRDEENDRYVVTGILANHIYDNYYIRVSESEGYAEYGFCVAAYLTDLMTHPSYSGNTELVALCKAMQVYGYNAESYFTN